MAKDVKELPDYGTLQHLARALWRDGSVRGAALLVGAGFTRNVVRPGQDTRLPPLWGDLERDLVEDLYRDNRKQAPRNPLRVAEEYRQSFGQSALDDFIRTRFPDKAWLPGPLHRELLSLPWSDILTTNWDTILERASEEISDRQYEIVRNETDLPYARSPRIIKLHGSIGDKGPLTFAEEDYRKYPTDHAAFVNLARQVFIENELCLLGFSGDDPNFLQWAGWVRDQLAGAARRIYLVGYLNLPAATKNFFRAHNIATIDFAPMLQDVSESDRWAEASRIFFEVLRQAKPKSHWQWEPAPFHHYPLGKAGAGDADKARKDDAFAQEVVENSAKVMKDDRETYPHWFVCPWALRQTLQHGGSEQWIWRKSVLERFDPPKRAQILFEVVWRRWIAFDPIESNIETSIAELLAGDLKEIDPGLVGQLALALMRNARDYDQPDAMTTWHEFILKKTPESSPVRLEAQYQLCLRARDVADFRSLEKLLGTLASDEPEWRLRRAALAAELGQYATATRLIKDAADDLELRFRRDPNSLWIKSRLGWADWLTVAVDMADFRKRIDSPRRQDFQEAKIDPPKEIQQIEDLADREETRQRDEERRVIPQFKAGHYRDNGKRITFRASPGLLRFEADHLISTVGLPIRLNHISLCGSMAVQVAKISFIPTLTWYAWLLRSIHSESDAVFVRYFSRVAMARLHAEVADSLINTVRDGMHYWLDRARPNRAPGQRPELSYASEMLTLYMTALAHLTVRMTIDDVEATLKLAITLAKEKKLLWHPSELKALEVLLSYSADSLPVDRLGALALEIIEFPLSLEAGVEGRFWPRPITPTIWSSKPQRDAADQRWRHRIEQLISAAREGQSRDEAILRLTYLNDHKILFDDERAAFGQVLWSKTDGGENALPASSGLLESTFIELPAPAGIDVRARVKARLVDKDANQILELPNPLSSSAFADKQNQLNALFHTRAAGFVLAQTRAAELFDQLTSWNVGDEKRDDPFAKSMLAEFNDGIRVRIGELLAQIVVPAMDLADLTEARGRALIALVHRTQAWRAAPGLPRFVVSAPTLENDIVTLLRRGILGTDNDQVAAAAIAISVWAKLTDEGTIAPQVPPALIERLIAAIESRQIYGLQTLIDVATKLVHNGKLDESDQKRLMIALSDLRAEMQYELVDDQSMLAVSISLIRAACVDLARGLQGHIEDNGTLAGWIEDAKADPLPEVRFKVAEAPQKSKQGTSPTGWSTHP